MNPLTILRVLYRACKEAVKLLGCMAFCVYQLGHDVATMSRVYKAELISGTAALIINAVIIVASVAYTLATQPDGEDQRDPGFGIDFRDIRTDPNAPQSMVYGQPRFKPDLIDRWVAGSVNNGTWPTGQRSLYLLFGCGWGGPDGVDGGNLGMWMNDSRLFDQVPDDAPIRDRRLVRIDGKRYAFPKDHVVPSTVAIFKDGNAISEHANFNASVLWETQTTKVRDLQVPSQAVYKNPGQRWHDPSMMQNKRWGAFLPIKGETFNFRVRVRSRGGIAAFTLPSGRRISPSTEYELTPDEWAASHVTFKSYKYIHVPGAPSLLNPWNWFVLDYDVKRQIKIERNFEGRSIAVFQDDQPENAEITATYQTSRFGENLSFQFRHGGRDQLPLDIPTSPAGSIPHTQTVNVLLQEGVSRVYETDAKVDDLHVELQSGNVGFFDQAVEGQNAGDTYIAYRHFRLRVKKRAAPDTATPGTDPDLGWVTLQTPWQTFLGKSAFQVAGSTQSLTSWQFGVGALLAYTQGENEWEDNLLPFDEWMVEITALDPTERRWPGNIPTAAVKNELRWSTTTEIRASAITNPNQTLLLLHFKDEETVDAQPDIEVQFRGRRCPVIVRKPGRESVAAADLTWDDVRVERRWTQNPVWVSLDLWTTKHGGAGIFYNLRDHVVLRDAILAAEWCDRTVTNDDGSTEINARYDAALQERRSPMEHLAQILVGARVAPTMRGGRLGFAIDADAEPIEMDLTDSDIHWESVEEVELSWSAATGRPTDLDVVFTNEAKGYKRDRFRFRLDKSNDRRGRIISTLDFSGVSSPNQAIRAAQYYGDALNLNKEQLIVTCDKWKHVATEAGDVVRVRTDARRPTGFLDGDLFRVVAVGFGSDMKVVLLLSEHRAAKIDAPRTGAGVMQARARPRNDSTPIVPQTLSFTRQAGAA